MADPKKIIDPRLPLKIESGPAVTLLHQYKNINETADEIRHRFCYISMIKFSPKKYIQESWDRLGNPSSGKSAHQLHNLKGYQATEVWLNIHAGGTTGYGYARQDLAQKYARADSSGEPVVARIKQTLIFKNPGT